MESLGCCSVRAASRGTITLEPNVSDALTTRRPDTGAVRACPPASSDDRIAEDFATNVFGTLAATKAFLPALRRAGARGEAAIVNVLSVVSLANMPLLGGYSASKAAAASMTQALRSDLAAANVQVQACSRARSTPT